MAEHPVDMIDLFDRDFTKLFIKIYALSHDDPQRQAKIRKFEDELITDIGAVEVKDG